MLSILPTATSMACARWTFGFQRRMVVLLTACVVVITVFLLGHNSRSSCVYYFGSKHFILKYADYQNTNLLRNLPSKINYSTHTLEQQCIKEVLQRLRMPLSIDSYLVMQPLPQDLKLKQLSIPCRNYLKPLPLTAERRRQLTCFLPEPWFATFGVHDRDRIDGALRLLSEAFRTAKIPLVLDSGTALGSYRMHGQIPYDPDVDFMILQRYKTRAKVVLLNLMATYPNLFKHYDNAYNFWRMDIIRPNGDRLFQVDLFVSDLNDEEHSVTLLQEPHTLNVSQLLPFVMRPFQGVLYHTWRNMSNYLEQMYGKTSFTFCKPAPWIPYYFKIACPTQWVPCEELNFFFNFVRRWKHSDGRLVEVLFNRTHVLGVFYAPEGV